MPNINTAIRYLAAGAPSGHFTDLSSEFKARDNAAFLAEVARQMKKLAGTKAGPMKTRFDVGGIATIGLIGSYGLLGYGIRRAQELIRVDRTPSYWSHAFLIASELSTDENANRGSDSAWIWESTLEPSAIFGSHADRNGVGPRRIGDYANAEFRLFDAHCVPNMAVIAIALSDKERAAILDRADDPDVDQLRYDISGLLGTWYAFLTSRTGQPNPLGAGNGIYCSAYVQLAYDAAGIDLAPGAHQRNTAPEHIWQTAKRLSQMVTVLDAKAGRTKPRGVATWYCVRDPACVVFPTDLPRGAQPPRKIREIVERFEARK